MKKYMYFFIMIFSCLLIFSGCSTDKSSNEISKRNNPNDNSNVEVISPDYITSDNKDNSPEVFATIYVSDMESDSIINKKVKVNEITSESIFKELKNENIIVSDTTLNSFTTYEDQNEELIGVLNLSEEFYNFNLGSGYESMMLNSIAKTYIENFKLDKFKILINDEEYESGHILIEKDEYFTKDSLE